LIQHKYQKPQSFPALASADTRGLSTTEKS
jgi:hypothetical protein